MVENVMHNDGAYALALQFGDYRRAARHAIHALRHARERELWLLRLRGCLSRRHVAVATAAATSRESPLRFLRRVRNK